MSVTITNTKFDATVTSATSFIDLEALIDGRVEWKSKNLESEEDKLYDRAFSLISCTKEGAILLAGLDHFDCSRLKARRAPLLNKMIDLAKNKEDIDLAYEFIDGPESHMADRDILRRLFDRADALGYPKD